VARPLRLDEVRGFEYIEVGERPWLYQGYGLGPLIPIVPCPRCGRRFVEDPTRDGRGETIPLPPGEAEREPSRCGDCAVEAFGEAIREDWLEMLERTLGLKEEDKPTVQALKSIIETPTGSSWWRVSRTGCE
jgi:hypothetical protein